MKIALRMKSKEKQRVEKSKKTYRPPRLVRIGDARKLVQGRNHGKYNDGYSGYYWEG